MLRRLALAAVAAVMLASCGSPAHHPTTAPTSTTSTTTTAVTSTTDASSTTTTSARGAPSSSPTTHATTRVTARSTTTRAPAHGGATHALTEADDGHTVTARTGDRITVTLSSTYWTFAAPSNGAVVRQDGDPVYAPDRNCVPGGGCGTVTASYTAIGPGSTHLTASRTSCGEALRCSDSEGSYDVTVTVT